MSRRPLMNRGERGAAAVEFALVAPLLILLVFGIIEFGRVWSARNVYISAAREGARVAAVGGTADAAKTRVQEASAPYAAPALAAIAVTPATACTDNAGGSVVVSWTQSFSLNIAFFSWAPGSYLVRSVFQCE